jgi:hypothetical protein
MAQGESGGHRRTQWFFCFRREEVYQVDLVDSIGWLLARAAWEGGRRQARVSW